MDRRARWAEADRLDVGLLLRAVLAWPRGGPGVRPVGPVPGKADEDRRRAARERQELLTGRGRLTRRIGALPATLGVAGSDARRADRRERVDAPQRPGGVPGGVPVPPCAGARLERLIARHEPVLQRLDATEAKRDRAHERASDDAAAATIRRPWALGGVGVRSAKPSAPAQG